MYNAFYFETKIGKIGIVENGSHIVQLNFKEINYKDVSIVKTTLLEKAYIELQEYLNGKRKAFNLPLDPKGTDFQKSVWNELLKIPYGTTCSYKDVAKCIDNAKAYRAVGLANNRNPIPIFIPCHRVIGSNGQLTGYAGGIELKENLLEIEKENLL